MYKIRFPEINKRPYHILSIFIRKSRNKTRHLFVTDNVVKFFVLVFRDQSSWQNFPNLLASNQCLHILFDEAQRTGQEFGPINPTVYILNWELLLFGNEIKIRYQIMRLFSQTKIQINLTSEEFVISGWL
jgi:hypothetical protein